MPVILQRICQTLNGVVFEHITYFLDFWGKFFPGPAPQFWRGGRRFFPADRERFLKDNRQKLPGQEGGGRPHAGKERWPPRRKWRGRQGSVAAGRRLTRKRECGRRSVPCPHRGGSDPGKTLLRPVCGPRVVPTPGKGARGDMRQKARLRRVVGSGSEFWALLRFSGGRRRQRPGTDCRGATGTCPVGPESPACQEAAKNAGVGRDSVTSRSCLRAGRSQGSWRRQKGRLCSRGREKPAKRRRVAVLSAPRQSAGKPFSSGPQRGARNFCRCHCQDDKKRRPLRVGVFHGRSRKRRYPFAAARAPEPLRGRASPGTVSY